jgi:GNAT superfamily N-acetyltransferase
LNGAFQIEKLRRDHAVDSFDSGVEPLNQFLIRYAWQSQQSGASQTYVGLSGTAVIGFYTLTVGEVAHAGAPERLTRGMPRHPIPLMVLARLAIDKKWQGRGLGTGLLKDALLRTEQAADIAGIRAIAVHAKDDKAMKFYARFGFEPSPTDAWHMFLLMKDVRRTLQGK